MFSHQEAYLFHSLPCLLPACMMQEVYEGAQGTDLNTAPHTHTLFVPLPWTLEAQPLSFVISSPAE